VAVHGPSLISASSSEPIHGSLVININSVRRKGGASSGCLKSERRIRYEINSTLRFANSSHSG
jgi:hypothetical protein